MPKFKSILLVDDEREVLDVLKELLEEYADSVLTAMNGQKALEILDKTRVDCIISDINMAPVNGPEFLKRVVERKLGDIPFLFYTAHGTEDQLRHIDLSQVVAIVAKPSFENLEREILKLIEV